MKKFLLLLAFAFLPVLGYCGGKYIKINAIGGKDKSVPTVIFYTGEYLGTPGKNDVRIRVTEAEYSNLCDAIISSHSSYLRTHCTEPEFKTAFSIAVNEDQNLVLMVPPFNGNCAKGYFLYLIEESKKTKSRKELVRGLEKIINRI